MRVNNIYEKVFFRTDKTDLSYEEAKELHKRENAILLDVRTPEEYREKHIDEAINIPLYEIDNLKNEIIDKDKVVLLYCRTGKRSKQAKAILMQNGYRNVYTFNAKI